MPSLLHKIRRPQKAAVWLLGFAAIAALAAGTIWIAVPRAKRAKAEKAAAETGRDLYGFRTPYAGDNIRVSNIAQRLPVPDALTQDTIALSTAHAPYAVQIQYGADGDAWENYRSDSARQGAFDRNAVLLFALVGNAEQVDFRLKENENEPAISRTREWADSVMGKNVWKSAETETGFAALYKDAEQKFSAESPAGKPIALSAFTAAEGSAELSGGKRVLVRLSMTEGQYYSDRYAGYGGGTYAANYRGTYELQVIGDGGKFLSRTAFTDPDGQPEANFPGKFTLLFDDYNGDGSPDFTVGQWGSSALSLYDVYTLFPDGTVKKTAQAVPGTGGDFSVRFKRDGGTGFFGSWYDNASGRTESVHCLWNAEKGIFAPEPVASAG